MNSLTQNRQRLFNRINSTPSVALSLCVFGSLTILSALSCILGSFYDDEIFNIKWAALLPFSNLVDFIKIINANDIHPPASYVLNNLTYDALGSWKAVKLVNGTLNAAAITLFFSWAVEKVAKQERLLLTFALATAVTSEMWGASLRWNAYFNPVFLILYAVALSKRLSITARTIMLTVGTIFLFHTSYLTVVATPVLWGTFIVTSLQELRPVLITRVAPIVLFGMVVCLPQLYVLITVHLPWAWYTGGFQGGAPYWIALLYSIPQSLSTLTVGNAVFPIDYIPCLYLLLLAAALTSSATAIIRDANIILLFGGVLLGLVLLVITNLGYEGRNAVFLYPISLTLIVVAVSRSISWVRFPTTVAFVLLQIMSVYNFVLHRNTAKGSYNTPFPQAVSEISSLIGACTGPAYIFTHDPVLTYLVAEVGGRVSSPYQPSNTNEVLVNENDCVIVVDTYRGVLRPNLYTQFVNSINSERFRNTRTLYLGYDRFRAIKTWITKESFPEYYITIKVYEPLENTTVTDWYHLATLQ
jgi:hypothetical protein